MCRAGGGGEGGAAQKYPLKMSAQPNWQTILIRQCGSKWAFQDAEIDGGKIWADYNAEWAAYMKRGRNAVKHGRPKIIDYPCKKKSSVPAAQQDLSHFADANGLDCQDVIQKWKDASSWPSSVTGDGGATFNRSDPWWRF